MPCSLSCTVFVVKRLLAILPAAVLLSACSVMEIVGPRANGEVMALARQAAADGFALSGDPVAGDMRSTQSNQLVAEAARLCGTLPDGSIPSSCELEFDDANLPAGATTTADMITQLRTATVAAADKVPDDSVDLVVTQAIDAVALAPVVLDPPAVEGIPEADMQSAQEMLSREYALEYGLGLATAWADEALLARIEALRSASDQRREALASALTRDGQAQEPLPGYDLSPEDAPVDLGSANALVDRLRTEVVEAWRTAATDAQSAQWRDAAIGFAAAAQRI